MKHAAMALLVLTLPTPAAAGILGEDAHACSPGQGPAILVTAVGLKDRRGNVKVELYPGTEADFLRDDRDLIREGKVFRRIQTPTPAAGPVSLCIRVPRPGRYGLLFTHDRDGHNKFDLWKDGAGVVSNTRLGRTRPQLAQSVVEVGGGVTTVQVRVQYLRGLAGFGPLG